MALSLEFGTADERELTQMLRAAAILSAFVCIGSRCQFLLGFAVCHCYAAPAAEGPQKFKVTAFGS
jgi:hypothetical protein